LRFAVEALGLFVVAFNPLMGAMSWRFDAGSTLSFFQFFLFGAGIFFFPSLAPPPVAFCGWLLFVERRRSHRRWI
jgi:hypothetical protein